MEKSLSQVNYKYIIGVSVIIFVLPVICSLVEIMFSRQTATLFLLIEKWFIFFAAGVRLFIAGIKQTTDPAFTAKQIFHIESSEALPIVRELGFANICLGLIGIISLLLPQWRIVSAFASGLYYALAGILHIIKKPAGTNEQFALSTDIIIFLLLTIYIAVIYFG